MRCKGVGGIPPGPNVSLITFVFTVALDEGIGSTYLFCSCYLQLLAAGVLSASPLHHRDRIQNYIDKSKKYNLIKRSAKLYDAKTLNVW